MELYFDYIEVEITSVFIRESDFIVYKRNGTNNFPSDIQVLRRNVSLIPCVCFRRFQNI